MIGPVAIAWHRQGFCAVPVKSDGSKAPALTHWTELQTRLPNDTELKNWWSNPDRQGFGLIMGAVSGNAEMLEFEGRAVSRMPEFLAAMNGPIKETFVKLWTGYRESTPSGGIHLVFRVSDGPALGNKKIARRPATSEELQNNPDELIKVLIETRGEGGFTVTAPSNGSTHPTGGSWSVQAGSWTTVPSISCAERDALYAALGSFDECAQAPRSDTREHRSTHHADNVFGSQSTHVSPLDAFNADADWGDILKPHGWTYSHTDQAGVNYWIRPGKDTPGFSASTNNSETGDRLWVFSTSTPFEAETPMSKAFVWAHYNHGGDMGAARAALYESGWGDRKRAQIEGYADAILHYCDNEGRVEGDPINELFDQRAMLRHIRHVARALQADPLAVLGITIARAVAGTPPNIVLPAIIGGRVSTNMIVVPVGESGDGKGAANAASRQAVEVIPHFACRDKQAIFSGIGTDDRVHETGLGTGQGIISRYVMREKTGELVPLRYSVLFDVPEIDTISAHAKMTGATVMSVVRSIYMGERLGDAYKDPKKDLHLDAHQVRCCFVISAQPSRCGVFIDDAAGGTPQRMLWVPTDDLEYGPENDVECPPRQALDLTQAEPGGPGEMVDVRVCAEAVSAIKGARRTRRNAKRNNQNVDSVDLDGHRLLNREKLAYGLAVLDGRFAEINSDDWALAEILLELSDHVRSNVQGSLAAAAGKENEQRARAQGRADHVRSAVLGELSAKAEQERDERVVEFVQANPGVGAGEVGRKFHLNAQVRDELLEHLVEQGLIETSEEPFGNNRTRITCRAIEKEVKDD